MNFILFFLMPGIGISQTALAPQCTLTDLNGSQINILDKDTISLRFNISGARFPTIGQDFQGICGLRIKFKHQNLSDLEIRLTSPDGTAVILIGPSNGVGTQSNFLQIGHDVIFRPRPTLAIPHPVLARPDFRWDSNNLDWGVNESSYDGSYYPFSGDLLTDLSGRAVNGIWELTIIDPFLNSEGIFEEFEIEFCEPTDLNCEPCEAIAGTFTQDTLVACQNSSTDFYDVFAISDTDSATHAEEFFVYDDQGTLLLADEIPDLSLLDSGTYFVHALNILQSNYDTIASDLQFFNRETLVRMAKDPGGFLCMELSDPLILIITRPDTLEMDATICSGETIMFAGNEISTGGVYQDTSENCTTITRLTVLASALSVNFGADTIYTECISGIIDYGALVTGANGTVFYEWRDNNGNIIGSDSSFIFSTSGDYQLLVRDDLCDTTLQLTALSSGAGFMVSIDADPIQLNCFLDTTALTFSSNFPADSVFWYKDGEFLSSNPSLIRVGEEGAYSVEVYGGRGCLITDSYDLSIDTLTPKVQVIASDITCTNDMITATYSSTDPILSSFWLSGTDTVSIGPQASIDKGGMYQLFIRGQNQCDTVITFEIQEDTVLLEVSGIPTNLVSLDCAMPSIDVTPMRDMSAVVDEFWIFGIDDTIRGSIDLTIATDNTYTYTAIPANGCLTTQSFEVTIDTIRPTFTAMSDSITCLNPEAQITLSGLNDFSVATFSGLNMIAGTDSSVIVDEGGLLNFTIDDFSNSCSTSDSITVIQNQIIPNISLNGAPSLTCQEPSTELSAELNGSNPALFYWIAPSGDTTFQENLSVSNPGTFRFEAVGTNGCLFEANYNLDDDRDLPDVMLPDSALVNCNSANVSLSIDDLTDIGSIRWIHGQDTISGPAIDRLATFPSVEVLIEGTNGCPATKIINIIYDTLEPMFSLLSDTLDCDSDSVLIVSDVLLDHHTFTWAGMDVAGIQNGEVYVSQPGAYGLSVADTTNGCSHFEVIDVIQDFTPPDYSVLPVDTLTCSQTSVNVSLVTSEENSVTWNTSDGRTEFGASVLASLQGQQYFNVVGENGCIEVDSVEVLDNFATPRVTLDDTYVISCNQEQFVLTPEIQGPFRTLNWSFNNGTSSNSPTETIVDDALESLTITGINGCQTRIDFNISFANDRPQASILTSDTIVCSGEDIEISTAQVLSPNHRIFWYSNNMTLAEDQEIVNISQSGSYILEVRDTSSGCFSMDTIAVLISPAPLTVFNIDASDESCDGANDGYLQVLAVLGGSGNVEINLDGELIGLMPIEPIEPGIYNISAEDEIGCVIDTQVTIRNGLSIEVDLGPDISVERGTKVTIEPQYFGERPESVIWTGSRGTSSENIDTLCYFPVDDETIYIEATTPTGCSAIDSVLVSVFVDLDQINIYVPNILSQNSTLSNNLLTLSLPEDVIEVTDFSIYDRWGQLVMHLDRIVNGEIIVAWDGRFNGKPVASGVYIYTYKMLTVYNNQIKTVAGDLTVIN